MTETQMITTLKTVWGGRAAGGRHRRALLTATAGLSPHISPMGVICTGETKANKQAKQAKRMSQTPKNCSISERNERLIVCECVRESEGKAKTGGCSNIPYQTESLEDIIIIDSQPIPTLVAQLKLLPHLKPADLHYRNPKPGGTFDLETHPTIAPCGPHGR